MTRHGTFTLTIAIGNADMSRNDDVADALDRVSVALVLGEESGIIRDPNGNTVGAWKLDAQE